MSSTTTTQAAVDGVEVTSSHDGAVRWLWLDRPEARNAVHGALLLSLTHALEAAFAAGEVRAIVLAGRGPVFCAGADRAELASTEQIQALTAALDHLVDRIAGGPKPVVCRVQGDAYGAGLALIGAADLSVAARPSRFGYPEVRHGLVATVAVRACGPRLGLGRSLDLFLTGRRFGAVAAREDGLLTDVVDPDHLDDAIHRRLDDLVLGDPTAMAATKSYVRTLLDPANAPVVSDEPGGSLR